MTTGHPAGNVAGRVSPPEGRIVNETELDAIERVWSNRCHGTHWHACHLNSGHHVCAINLLSGEVRRLRRELAEQKAATIALAERIAACSAVLGKAAERGKVCDCQRPQEGTT